HVTGVQTCALPISYGHASSAPIHWLSSKRSKLSGGVFHQLSAHKTINPNELIRLNHPNPTDWRVPVEVPMYEPLINEMTFHSQWIERGFSLGSPDFVVIELGANDVKSIYRNGAIYRPEYDKRKRLAQEMALQATAKGARCLWIGPPHGRVKT